MQEQMPMRGFESTVDNRLNFGLGKTSKIDSVVVIWNDGKQQILKNVQPNQHLTIKQADAAVPPTTNHQPSTINHQPPTINTIFTQSTTNYGIDFVHKENDFVDFDRDRLIFQMLSTQGPRIAKGDVNKDGLDDIYICGAKDQPGALYIQTKEGQFIKTNEALLLKDAVQRRH